MGAAKATPPGKAAITAYVTDRIKTAARKQAFDHDLNVSAIVEALLERHLAATRAEQAPIITRAREIAEERRRRGD